MRSEQSTISQTAHARGSAGVLVGIGLVALLYRAQVLTLPGDGRAVAIACILAAVLAASLLVPIPAELPRLRPSTALMLGLGAVGLATLFAGRPPRVTFATWALPLSLLAGVAEEALFRRATYGWLARYGAVVAVLGSAALFAAIHLPFYGLTAMPVDLGAGLLLSWQRWASGNWTVPAATHAAANILAVIVR
ncbi:MAG: CPBP family intramembrane metalloprotease [Actinomycetota bacterium]|nr:CPBP family intramembrane metalloprotease [Actinomycetota bacterium]